MPRCRAASPSCRPSASSIRTIPPERMLFGTDAPLLDPAFVLGTYQDAGIPAADEDRIYWDNAARLYGVD